MVVYPDGVWYSQTKPEVIKISEQLSRFGVRDLTLTKTSHFHKWTTHEDAKPDH
jgi:hypothetical protein